MSNLPAFHSRATREAEARTAAAKDELDRVGSFLEELDELLAHPSTQG